jgi:hypothetical protein
VFVFVFVTTEDDALEGCLETGAEADFLRWFEVF